MSVPENFRTSLRDALWSKADELGWTFLNSNEKAIWYENWTKEEAIGGVLRRFMDAGQVRVYIKDSLLKEYTQFRLSDPARVYRVLQLDQQEPKESFEKPHGHLLLDGRVVCWGKADNWKTVLLATFERAFANASYSPFASVLLLSTGRYHDSSSRELVINVANRLSIQRLEWLD